MKRVSVVNFFLISDLYLLQVGIIDANGELKGFKEASTSKTREYKIRNDIVIIIV